MGYSWLNFRTAKRNLLDLFAQPHDSTGFWTDLEMGIYIKEALRTWQAAAQYHRDQDTFSTSPTVPIYDLTQTLTNGLLAQTVTDVQVYQGMLYQLMETPVEELSPNTLTEQFIPQDLIDALQRSRDQFLVESGAFLTQVSLGPGAPTNGRVTLADSVIDIRRATWRPTGGSFRFLHRSDEWTAGAYIPRWQSTPGTPSTYSFYTAPSVGLTLIPVPSTAGTLQLLTASTGPALSNPPTPLPAGTVLGIPDDWAWVVKWKALADVLSRSGEATDSNRTQYCQKMWETGTGLARMADSVKQVAFGSSIMNLLTFDELDSYNPGWMNTPGTPTTVALGGLNLVGLSPVPNAVITITIDVVQNMPIPVLDTDFIQVGREVWDTVLKFAFHLGMFKVGGQEWEETFPMAEELFTRAMEFRERDAAEALDLAWLSSRLARQQPPEKIFGAQSKALVTA